LSNRINFIEKGLFNVKASITDGQLCVRIRDTGIGIRAEDLENLFKPFSQIDTGLSREHEGTGLGLAICQKLCSLIGGRIGVSSRWQQGSEFVLYLPLQAQKEN